MRSTILLCALCACAFAHAQSPRIRVYFNQDTDPTVSSGTLATSLHAAMDDTLEAYIDRAQYTIDVAVYNADDFSIMYALNDARDRGVQVRYITEGSNTNSGLNTLNPAIPVLERTDGQGSGMHNKFMSIDADHADLAWVWSGSTNWTQGGLFNDYNNMVFIQDQALALAYRTEFEEMWGSTGPQPNVANSRFGADKTNNTTHTFTVDGVLIESYFSPTDGTTAQIVNEVNEAQHSVRAALFSFTNDAIGDALLAADQRPGVTVQLDLEDAIYSGTEGWYLESNGVDVATHNTDNVQLHHKYAIIDEGSTDDPLVITGSHNWSWNAELINDENTLIIHDATVANLFYQEWHARRNDVVGINEVAATDELLAWPSPAQGELHLLLPDAMRNARIDLLDMTGRVLASSVVNGLQHGFDVSALAEGNYLLVCSNAIARVQRSIAIIR
jgi:phosphatidylserine/phosphatidylglycerophosphate/cardiolipin synthase-like enzyme